jgi:regulator of replication initiation timing
MSKISKKELLDANQTMGYDIEALEEEVDRLMELLQDKHEKLVNLINENDRLTMRYEPYRPEGDEDYGKDFYELIEENNRLRRDNLKLTNRLWEVEQAVKEIKPKKKYRKNGVVSFDFWPLSEWVRFSHNKWDPGKAAQLAVGPIRFDWFAD